MAYEIFVPQPGIEPVPPALEVWSFNHWTARKVPTSFNQFFQITSISPNQFSPSVVSDFLWPHRLQEIRFPCPSPTPRAYSNSCPSRQWCHPTISSSVIPFSSCLQSFPASGSLPMSQFFVSGGQNIGVSASASVLPMNIQDLFPLGCTGWMSLLSKRLSSLLQHHSSKASILRCSAFFTDEKSSL